MCRNITTYLKTRPTPLKKFILQHETLDLERDSEGFGYLSYDLGEVIVQEASRMSLLVRQTITTLRGFEMRTETGAL
jgi:hypothetical protein